MTLDKAKIIIAIMYFDINQQIDDDVLKIEAILQDAKGAGSPNNLYKHTKSYFTKRTAILATNSIRMVKELSRSCSQGSCSVPGYWNLPYKSLLKIK